MKENVLRAAVTAALAAFAAYFEVLFIPIIIVFTAMICDYISGMIAAHVTNEYSSSIGIIGIAKKVAYGLMIVVSMLIDWVVQMVADTMGVFIGHFCYFALLVIIWLVINECISILENVARMGVNMPPYILKIANKLKSVAEAKGEERATNLSDNN